MPPAVEPEPTTTVPDSSRAFACDQASPSSSGRSTGGRSGSGQTQARESPPTVALPQIQPCSFRSATCPVPPGSNGVISRIPTPGSQT